VIIVASVSCIYGLGSPAEYERVNFKITIGDKLSRTDIMKHLIAIHYNRTTADLEPATFRVVGTRVDVMPVADTYMYQIETLGGAVSRIIKVDPITSQILSEEQTIFIFPAKHFITKKEEIERAVKDIKDELTAQLKHFEKEGKLLEGERIKRRTNYDLAMIKEVGYCNGIENYSRHLSGKAVGEAPDTLLSYFPEGFLTFIDESHVTLPQLTGMYAGDASRKQTLVEFGFRLPSAKDNRPLKYPEFEKNINQVVYVSATPGKIEHAESDQIVEQIIRPTGLIDPQVDVRPIMASSAPSPRVGEGRGEVSEEPGSPVLSATDSPRMTQKKEGYPGQVQDFIRETEATIAHGGRVLATTLTKRMAEDLATYLKERHIKAEYLHSEIKTIDRIRILTQFRRGEFDCLVGVNLLREGLDLPEVELIGILDADKEGFLRSDTALIQTIGRAARNVFGRVILYADRITGSMERALEETNRRRAKQVAYNTKHGITPQTIIKQIKDIASELESDHEKAVNAELSTDLAIFSKLGADGKTKPLQKLIKLKEKEMASAVKELDFETAAILRDEIKFLNAKISREEDISAK
jgi:excinuclease ABC subunit B